MIVFSDVEMSEDNVVSIFWDIGECIGWLRGLILVIFAIWSEVADASIGLIWSNLLRYSSYLLLLSIILGAMTIFIFLLACDVQSLVSSS